VRVVVYEKITGEVVKAKGRVARKEADWLYIYERDRERTW